MRIITQKIEAYEFDELSDDVKEKVSYDIVNSLFECFIEERIDSLKALATRLNVKLDYSISFTRERSSFISLKGDIDDDILKELSDSKDTLALTGVCYDYDVIEALEKGSIEYYLDSIEDEYFKLINDYEYISDHCDANKYEFTADGELI